MDQSQRQLQRRLLRLLLRKRKSKQPMLHLSKVRRRHFFFAFSVSFFFFLALNRAGSIKPAVGVVETAPASLKMAQIKPLPKRRIADPPEQSHLTKEAWFRDVSDGSGRFGVTKEESELLKKYYVLIEAPPDPKVRKD